MRIQLTRQSIPRKTKKINPCLFLGMIYLKSQKTLGKKPQKYLKEHFAFNEESNDDKDANVENPNTDEKISNVAKTLLDAYYDALATEKDSAASGNENASESTGEDAETEKTKQASEAFLNKVKELLNDGKISEDDAKKLEKEFAKTDTEDGDIEDEMTESDAGDGSNKGDDTEAVAAE